MGNSFLQGISTWSGVGSSTGCNVDTCSDMVLHGLQGDNLHYHGLSMGCRGVSAPVPGAPLPPPSLTLVFLGLFLTVFSSLLSLLCGILPFLKCVFPEAPPAWLMSSAVSHGGSIGAGWSLPCPAQGSPWPFLTEALPCSPPLPTPCHGHPMQIHSVFVATLETTEWVLIKKWRIIATHTVTEYRKWKERVTASSRAIMPPGASWTACMCCPLAQAFSIWLSFITYRAGCRSSHPRTAWRP